VTTVPEITRMIARRDLGERVGADHQPGSPLPAAAQQVPPQPAQQVADLRKQML